MVLDHIPYDVVVNARVMMHDEIAKADDLLPLDFGVSIPFVEGYLCRSFANYDQPTNDGVEGHAMTSKLFKRQVRSVLQDDVARLDNVLQ